MKDIVKEARANILKVINWESHLLEIIEKMEPLCLTPLTKTELHKFVENLSGKFSRLSIEELSSLSFRVVIKPLNKVYFHNSSFYLVYRFTDEGCLLYEGTLQGIKDSCESSILYQKKALRSLDKHSKFLDYLSNEIIEADEKSARLRKQVRKYACGGAILGALEN